MLECVGDVDSTFLIKISNELDYIIIIQFHSHFHYLIPAVKLSPLLDYFGETQKNYSHTTFTVAVCVCVCRASAFASEQRAAQGRLIKLVLDLSIRQTKRLISSLVIVRNV